jgi:hypothetical protein
MKVCALALTVLMVCAPAYAQSPSTGMELPSSLPAGRPVDTGSHVALAAVTPIQVANLATLARVWGFLKYHHPLVTAGQRQWDFELLRIMPVILAAPDRAHANDELAAWIDRLGPISSCNPCLPAPAGDLSEKAPITWIYDQKSLGLALSQRLQSVYVNRTGRQFYVSLTKAGNPSFDHELAYPQLQFPDTGAQLLGLFRWWNILQYWAPYREAAGQDWAAILSDFIPRLALAKDKADYQLALFELIAKANDSHANLWSSLALRPPVGDCAIPVALRFINGKAVVYRSDNARIFRSGDSIDELEGASVASLIAKWTPYYGASNEAARQRDLAAFLTRGPCGPVSVSVLRDGRDQHVAAERVEFTPRAIDHGDALRVLSTDVAYMNLSDLKAVDLPAYFDKAKDTKGLVIDIRNYPVEALQYALGAYLAAKPTSFVSLALPDLANPGAFQFADGAVQAIMPGAIHYQGRVMILVDETTQSAAEFTAMALRAMPNALVMGSTTAGADGNVSAIVLPGGLGTMISGLGVFYPDHHPTQRIGIVPDIVVKPTVQGIAAGHDEILEAAMRQLADRR